MAYSRINWQNEPSEATALNDVNLNKMDGAIYELDGKATATDTAITALQNGKVDKVNGKGLSQVDNVTVTQHVAYGTVVSTIKTYKQDGTEVTSQVCNGINVDSALSDSSTNPVQNKAVKSALDGKVDKESGKGLSQVDNVSISSTTSAGTKIGEITVSGVGGSAVGTNLYNGVVVDSALSNESENPVQNKVVKESISDILPTNTATGNPIVINDGMKLPASECKVTMNPIQDLHGYSNPWAGGAGKNLLDIGSRVNQTTASIVYTSDDNYITMNGTKRGGGYANLSSLTISLEAGTYYAQAFVISGTSTSYPYIYLFDGTANLNTSSMLGEEREITIDTAKTCTIRVGIFTDGEVFTNYKIGIVISKTSGITSWSPYSNICPISGRTEASVKRTGKNLADFVNGKGIDNDGSITDSLGRISTVNPILIQSGSSYIFKQFASTESRGILAVFNGSTLVRRTANIYPNTTLDTSGGDRFYFCVYSDVTVESAKAMIILSTSTATAYEPYQGETYTHQYSETIYGGVDDFVSGEGKSEMIKVTIQNFNAFSYQSTTNFKAAYASFNSLSMPKISTEDGKAFLSRCDAFKQVDAGTRQPYGTFSTYTTGNGMLYLWDNDDHWGSKEAFVEEMTEVGSIELCYELATPTPITNTSEDISLLKGVNVLSTDGDSLEVKYSGEIQTSGGVDYSTDEQDTGIKWIDGKTIYQKTLTGTISRGEYEYYFLCVIGTLSNAHLIKSEGVVWNDNNGYQLPLNSAGTTNSMPTGDLQTFLYNRAGTLCLTLTQDSTLVGYNYAVTIYYTKA